MTPYICQQAQRARAPHLHDVEVPLLHGRTKEPRHMHHDCAFSFLPPRIALFTWPYDDKLSARTVLQAHLKMGVDDDVTPGGPSGSILGEVAPRDVAWHETITVLPLRPLFFLELDRVRHPRCFGKQRYIDCLPGLPSMCTAWSDEVCRTA